MCVQFDYGVRWRYEFNNSKSGIVTFGETKSQHFISMNKRRWVLCSETMEELCEYKNRGVLKNYVWNSANIKIVEFSKTMFVRFPPLTLKKLRKSGNAIFGQF